MPARKQIITGPDIDKLAHGIYGPEVRALADQLKVLTGNHRVQGAEMRKLRKQLRGALAHQETLLQQLAAVKEKNARLLRENVRLRAQLLNRGITPEDCLERVPWPS